MQAARESHRFCIYNIFTLNFCQSNIVSSSWFKSFFRFSAKVNSHISLCNESVSVPMQGWVMQVAREAPALP